LSVAVEPVAALEERLGHHFGEPALLERALTHKSYTNESRFTRSQHNETLEFLGDAVLGFLIGEMIFRAFPNLQEGALSKIKAHLVSAPTLALKARELDLGRYLRMGSGEWRSGGANKDSLLSNTFEAVIAALYLDGGVEPVTDFVARMFDRDVAGIDVADLSFHDYKTLLQEVAQSSGLPLPEYRVVDEFGPDHQKVFVVELLWDGNTFSYGRGPSKKEGQRQAARVALVKLGKLFPEE
jgi:ribonuclease III